MAFFDLFRPARQIENPATPITAGVIRQSLYSGSTATFDTSPDYGALRFVPIFAAERLVTETIASFPLLTYHRLDDDGRERATDVPQYRLLHDAPNDYQTPFIFWSTVVRTAIRRGNAFVYVERNNANLPVSLLLLDSLKVTVRLTNQGKQYLYNNGDFVIDDADCIHILGFTNDGICGVPLLEYCSNAVALGLAAEQWGLRYFTQGSGVGGVIELNGWPTPEQFKQLKDSWESAHSGIGNAHKTAILPNGKYVNPGSDNQQSQFLELRRWQLLEVARIFRIPPHLLGDLERATFSNIEQQGQEFISNAIRPWLTQIEQEVNRKVWSPSQQGSYFAEFLLDELLRGDTAQRYTTYQIGRQGGWLSVNDIRRKENMPPVEGGDEYLTPLNMSPVGKQQEQPKESDEPAGEATSDPNEAIENEGGPNGA